MSRMRDPTSAEPGVKGGIARDKPLQFLHLWILREYLDAEFAVRHNNNNRNQLRESLTVCNGMNE